MEQLNCFICRQRVPGALKGLSTHFVNAHGLTIKRGIGGAGFKCDQDGCQRRFSFFYDLRRHIARNHLNRAERYDRNIDDVGMDNDDEINVEENLIPNIDADNQVEMDNHDIAANIEENFIPYDDDEIDFDLRKHVVKMVARFQCKAPMTATILTEVLEECEQLLLNTRDFLKRKVQRFCSDRGLLDDQEVKTLLDTFQFDSPFDGLKSLSEQIEALKNYCNYIEPIDIPLGYRLDSALDKKSCTYKPKMVMETFQYVPIIPTLSLVLSSPEVRGAILTERKSPDGLLASFLDGQHAQTHPFFLEHPNSIRIQMYYDGLEIVNPLGSKTGVHTLGVFYYTIQNIPPHMNSDLNSIHVLALCSDADVKKYGVQKILAPFLQDLAKLESDEGVLINTGDGDFVLRASIAAFCGDGLAVHDVFNLLSPSANFFCRMCMYSRADLHAGRLQRAQERSEDLFNEHLALLERTNYSAESKSATGVKGDCSLHRSRYFHQSRNKIFDPMHDILGGIFPMVLKSVTHEYVLVQRLFSCVYFNEQISSFQYGYIEMVNKPSANFTDSMLRKNDHSLSLKAMQMWCLMRAFPFLVSDKVPAHDPHMALVITLLQITEIVFAPKITVHEVTRLENLITSFHLEFQRLFPNVHPINKFHHLSHYPECILWSGPLVNYWCMRYEAKHGEIKNRAQNIHNFKNPPKTLVRIAQCGQSAKWGDKDVRLHRFSAPHGRIIPVGDTASREALHDLDYIDTDEVFCSKSVRVDGVEFRLGLYVCLEVAAVRNDNLPLFGCIKEIVVLRNTEIYLLTSTCTMIGFDANLNAFHIEFGDANDPVQLVKTSNLAHFKPFCCWTKSDSNDLYVSLRHIML